ncbi:MAG: serine hydrolase [Planctomycetota bacterium]
MWRPIAVLGLLLTLSIVASADSTQADLEKTLGPMIASHEGDVAVALKHLGTGQTYAYRADQPMPSASLIKLPLMVAVYDAAARGELSLDDQITMREADKAPGSGLLTPHFSDGATLTVRDAVRLMIGWSDNTATNLVIDALGRVTAGEGGSVAKAGIEACNTLMDNLDYSTTRLNSKVFDRSVSVDMERSEKYGLGVIGPAELVDLCESIVDGTVFGDVVDEGEARKLCDEMLGHLRACQSTKMAPSRLPPETVVAHKTGSVDDVRCDAGVIESSTGPIAFCVMTASNKDQSWEADASPHTLIGEITKAAFTYFTEGPGAVDAPRVARVLRMGQDDPLVRPLQRTLNKRLEPSPNLGVDGDYGPNTQKAVKAFQRQAGIPETGEVDGPTWNALGPLVMEDDPVPAPEVLATQLPPLKPQDAVTGPPVVSCAAWAIADGRTGKVLWGYNDAEVRDPASTTKAMTAYVVCELADEDPSVLDEVITFSERADKTSGSTADVNAGEQVTAGELLYGLMLPSGNDASVAFAEHFGDRFPDEEGKTSYDKFISAMNTTAEELGMNETGYRNPHGLTAEGHVTSARDLVKLAHAAMQHETFCKVVATRRRGATLDSVAGYQRNVDWKNTDRLLNYEGFYGIKTGTTGPAGACLMSVGTRGGKPLYVVILGASTSQNRYLDARNLYRWAWKELGVE